MNFDTVSIRTFLAAQKTSVTFRRVVQTYDTATAIPVDVDTDTPMDVMLRTKRLDNNEQDQTKYTITARVLDFITVPVIDDKFVVGSIEYVIKGFDENFTGILYKFDVET